VRRYDKGFGLKLIARGSAHRHLPPAHRCWLLLDWSGALLPLILYYGVFCVAIVLWRKESLDYVRSISWPFKLFIGLLAL
jgi:hypothetical protein